MGRGFFTVGVGILDRFYGVLRNFPYEKAIEEKLRKPPHILSNLSNLFCCRSGTEADIVALRATFALAKSSVAQLCGEAPL